MGEWVRGVNVRVVNVGVVVMRFAYFHCGRNIRGHVGDLVGKLCQGRAMNS